MIPWREFNPKYEFNLEKFDRNNSYCNDIFTLDMEVSTVFRDDEGNWVGYDRSKNSEYYRNRESQSIPYMWMLSVNSSVYYGRELVELKEFIEIIYNRIKGNSIRGERHMQIWVHNLSYEFQFLRNIFRLENVMSRIQRQPMYCSIQDMNIQFRCSYILSNLKLEEVSKHYNLNTRKLVGDLDYNLVRTPMTQLTEEELAYCENDCMIVYEFIKKMKQEYGEVRKGFGVFPLTDTSKVRLGFKSYLRETNYDWGVSDWHKEINKYIPSLSEFKFLQSSFQGGYVHANAYHVNQTIYNVKSIDEASAYTYTMMTDKYPSSKFFEDSVKGEGAIGFDDIISDDFLRILVVSFKDLKLVTDIPYISGHKLLAVSNVIYDNGRLWRADEVLVTITSIDYEIMKELYTWNISKSKIIQCYSCTCKRLPVRFRKYISKLYRTKSILKVKLSEVKNTYGEDSKEYKDLQVEYRISKSRLNSLFGMSVTNIINEENPTFNSEDEGSKWDILKLTDEDIGKMLDDMRHKPQLVPYSWGVFITAYARRNLILMANKFENDYLYMDTDSIKYLGDYDDIINEYNAIVDGRVKEVCNELELDEREMLGLGRFESDGNYTEFRTLGSKKYAYRDMKDGRLKMTVSGVNKKEAYKSLNDNIGNFNPTLKVIPEYSGNLLVSYKENQEPITVTDIQGNVYTTNNNRYGITMYPIGFNLDLGKEYLEFVTTIQGMINK